MALLAIMLNITIVSTIMITEKSNYDDDINSTNNISDMTSSTTSTVNDATPSDNGLVMIKVTVGIINQKQ